MWVLAVAAVYVDPFDIVVAGPAAATVSCGVGFVSFVAAFDYYFVFVVFVSVVLYW